jgi:cytoskeleton protein RodZ
MSAVQAIGERLREARMRRKIDIAEVEAATKIRAKYLRALEHEDFGLLPGPTFVKTFLRTYAEYLGLDAQLLIEEYRAQFEPREPEPQPFVPPSRRRRDQARRQRTPRGPPGPGTAVLVAVAVILVIFVILGITGGSGGGNGSQTARSPQRIATTKPRPAAPQKPVVTTVAVRVVPANPTYVCVDHGLNTAVTFQGILAQPRTFHGKVVRINSGQSNVGMTVNGKPFTVPQSQFPIGYSFTPHNAVPLQPAQRPCIATK